MCPVRRRRWHPTPVLLPGKSHGQRSLVGYGPWGREESDTTERLHFHFSLSCIGEGNGDPLQCSCLENPRDGEPGGLLSMGSHRVGHDWSDLAAAAELSWNSLNMWAHRKPQWKSMPAKFCAIHVSYITYLYLIVPQRHCSSLAYGLSLSGMPFSPSLPTEISNY